MSTGLFIQWVFILKEIIFFEHFSNTPKVLIILLIFLVIYRVKDLVRGLWKRDIFNCLL